LTPPTQWAATLGPRAASYLLSEAALHALWGAVRGRAVAAPAPAPDVDAFDEASLAEGVLDYEAYRQVQ